MTPEQAGYDDERDIVKFPGATSRSLGTRLRDQRIPVTMC